MAATHLTAAEAAARLGIKRETLYAYVSRGQLHRTMSLDGRSSLFDPAEIDALRSRRRGTPSGELSTVISSSVTRLDEAGHAYRTPEGPRPAVALADTSFETVADLVWDDTGTWTLDDACARLVDDLTAALGRSGSPVPAVDRLRIAVSAASSTDPARHATTTRAQTAAARRMIAAMTRSLGGPRSSAASPPDAGAGVAHDLWHSLTPHDPAEPPTPEQVAALNASLVLLLDHGLAASTFAVRVAGSVRADPYSMVIAGLGPLGGRIHGAASGYVHRFFADAEVDGLTAVIGRHLEAGRHLPGMGHAVYTKRDARKVELLERVRVAFGGDPRLAIVREAEERFAAYETGPHNVDFALGALTWLAAMEPWAGEAIFAIARTAGWVAHGMEELREPALRFRPVARYVEPRPPLPEDEA